MSELATVRAQVKAWERSFKDANGRPPTVDDIKQNPDIADKYKLYKRLSKAVPPSNTAQACKSVALPSTPPRKTRPKDSTTLLLSKSRPIQPPTPLASFNPFSPQKKRKGKEKEVSFYEKSQQGSNPFVQADPTQHVRRVSSPDFLPVLQPFQSSSATSSLHFDLNPPPLPTSAVSRARKRLRGEPVSPSPNKDKRRRVASQTSLPFPRFKLHAPGGDDHDNNTVDTETSFVDNSPVKAPIPGKSYQQLFGESTMPTNLFGPKGIEEAARVKSKSTYTVNEHLKPSRQVTAPKQTSNDLAIDMHHTSSRDLPAYSIDKKVLDTQFEFGRPSVKRAFFEEDTNPEAVLLRDKSPLIPPSPPPGGGSTPFNKPGKIKAGAKNVSRKKAKIDNQKPLDENSDDPEQHETKSKLRIIGRNAVRRRHASTRQDEEDASDSDPILGYTRFTAPRASSHENAPLREGNVGIDLPDELRSVLALQSADSKSQVSEEDRIVKGLLYGRRTNHYDPLKGGEIWDVGEDHHVDGIEGGTEGEDDWEGEPVPWEVGEL